MIPHARYQIRPAREHDESLQSYLYRFYMANGHAFPESARRAIANLFDGSAAVRRQAMNLLRRMVGSDCLTEATWWLDISFPFRSLLGNGDLIKLCPKCLGERGIHFSTWDLPLVAACPVHHVRLLVRCPGCKASLRWSHLRPGWHCRCNLSLREMTADGASRFELERSATLIATHYPKFVKTPPCAQFLIYERRVPLELLYEEQHQALKFRAVIIQALRGRDPAGLRANIRVEPHYWELRLFRTGAKSIQESLLRLLRRYWRGNQSILILVDQDLLVKQILKNIGISLVEPGLLPEASQALIKEYRVQIAINGLVVFNPRYGQEERDERLLRFWRWWLQLKRLYAEQVDYRPISYILNPNKEYEREFLIVSILTALMNAASSRVNRRHYLPVFARMMYWGEIFHPSSAIRVLSNALIRLPQAYLVDIYLILNGIATRKAKCRRHGS